MNIRIDDVAIDKLNLTDEQLRFDLAVGLYVNKSVSLGKAAAVANMGVIQFQRELGKRQIPMNYGVEDFRQDLKTLELLRAH